VTTGFTGKLIGVMHGSGNSYAVVSYNNNKYILIEGEVQDGLELIETGYFHAVVKNNGKEYRLLLDEQGKNADAKRPSSSSVSSGGDTLTSKISRKEVVENLSDVNSVIKTVLITPYERQGKFVGYRIARLSRRSVLNKIGINRGDIVVRLNGRGLTNPTVFFDTLSNAETLNSITLDIERKGVKKTIYVEIEG
jgi:general secretion pathway protein C